MNEWSLTLRDECRLKVFGKGMLKRKLKSEDHSNDKNHITTSFIPFTLHILFQEDE
jgi:hypothetical protein